MAFGICIGDIASWRKILNPRYLCTLQNNVCALKSYILYQNCTRIILYIEMISHVANVSNSERFEFKNVLKGRANQLLKMKLNYFGKVESKPLR